MPGGTERTSGRKRFERAVPDPVGVDAFRPSVALVASLRPWVDLDELGVDALEPFLRSIVPLLPLPAAAASGATDIERRVGELARALAECAGDRARAHFQASQYFQENRLLARRLKALEASLGSRVLGEGRSGPARDRESERAAERYLPPPKKR